MQFPTVKLLDYQLRMAELETAANPFALATAAHLLAQATRHDEQQRFSSKLALTRRLYQRGWNKQEVVDLYEFIDWLLVLPETLEAAYLDEVQELEEDAKMRYISSAERLGMKRGQELGLQQGSTLVLLRQLRKRFGDLPDWVEARLREGTPAQLEQWAEQVLDAETLESVFKEQG